MAPYNFSLFSKECLRFVRRIRLVLDLLAQVWPSCATQVSVWDLLARSTDESLALLLLGVVKSDGWLVQAVCFVPAPLRPCQAPCASHLRTYVNLFCQVCVGGSHIQGSNRCKRLKRQETRGRVGLFIYLSIYLAIYLFICAGSWCG